MSLSEMETRGELEPLASTPEELIRLLSMVRRRLKDAAVVETSNEARFEHAYHAILGCALAALRVNDYRVFGSAGKHLLALNTLQHTVGVPAAQVRYYQKLRNRRNIDLYEGSTPVSETELSEALAAAQKLLTSTAAYVKQRRADTR